MRLALPTGRNGQFLAWALLFVMIAIVWAGLIRPVITLYGERDQRLSEQRLVLAQMTVLSAALPRLRQTAADAAAHLEQSAFIGGTTDAVASANLENLIQDFASKAHVAMSRTESLPTVLLATYRKVGVRFDLKANQPDLIALLLAIEQAQPPMILDDIRLRGAPLPISGTPDIVDCSLSVYALRQPSESGTP